MTETISFPQKTVFGEGSANTLSAYLPEDCPVLFVTGRHGEKTFLPRITAQFAVRKFAVVSGIIPELPLGEIERVRQAAKEINAGAIVAIGGGSVIDAGKAAAPLVGSLGGIEDYFYGKLPIPERKIFFAALPTTAGTGAEATPNSVACDPATGIKQSIRHSSMLADLALVDPELTYGCPAGVTAASGFDALTQAIEAMISRKGTVFTGALALQAAKLLFHALPKAMNDDKKSRHDMAYGSMLTALAFAQCGLGAVHGLAHPIGSRCHVPHGVACAVLLPEIMSWNKSYLETPAREMGFASADKFIQAVADLRQALNLPENFRDYGFGESDFEFVTENCRSGSMKCNPRELSDSDIAEILQKLC